MNQPIRRAVPLAGASLLLLIAAWRGNAQSEKAGRGDAPNDTPPQTTTTIIGQSLPGLTDDQKQAFQSGLRSFSNVEVRADGLGPVFNGTACAECHKAGAIGGAGLDLTTARVTRIGGMKNGAYSDMEDYGGPVLQARSLQEFDTSCPITGEVVPRQAQFVSHRITTPLFGAGLLEAIPDAAILARAGKTDSDGVNGTANMVFNPETGQTEVGRFGWKAQHSTLHLFAGDAYLNEMGITNTSFPNENLPQGKPIPAGWGSVSSPEDQDGDVAVFTSFMQYLAPPGRRLPITPQVQTGEKVFAGIKCVSCHVPAMTTGTNPVAALSQQTVGLYSDLLVHHLGRGLADGIVQGLAQGDQFRTAPLWGLSRRSFFLHDGRAGSPEEAILNHGGEALAARNRFLQLPPAEHDALMAFLGSL